MAKRQARVHGLFVIDKPSGITSHDVVDAIRRRIHERQVGHAGTLDPLATGVLVVVVGAATRLAEFMVGHPKTYRFTVRLGVQTDTDDATGQVVEERPVPSLSPEAIVRVLTTFEGTQEQIPPRYAAIRHQGKRLYEWAREGVTVDPPPRTVTIYRLTLLKWEPPELHLEVTCSAGTYVRALARDLAQALGTVGHVTALRRMASGPFRVEDAVPLTELLKASDWRRYLHPPDAGLVDIKIVDLTPEHAQAMLHGRLLHGLPPGDDDQAWARAYLHGHFIGMIQWDAQQHAWRPRKVFPALITQAITRAMSQP